MPGPRSPTHVTQGLHSTRRSFILSKRPVENAGKKPGRRTASLGIVETGWFRFGPGWAIGAFHIREFRAAAEPWRVDRSYQETYPEVFPGTHRASDTAFGRFLYQLGRSIRSTQYEMRREFARTARFPIFARSRRRLASFIQIVGGFLLRR